MNHLPAASIACALLACFSAHAADLTVEVRGVAEPPGPVLIGVYDKAESWLRKPMKTARAEWAAGTVIATVAGLPEGTYAVTLFVDQNGNGKLDSNLIRIPVEPYGFSNNATGMMGPPSFDAARFALPAAGARIVIRLRS